jgi:hypothetical protein
MSDFRYEIKETSLPFIWHETSTEIRVGPYATNTHNWFLVPVFREVLDRSGFSVQVDLVEVKVPGPQTSGFQLDFLVETP